MEELIYEIKKKKDFQYKYFVDTGPLVDRELAKKSRYWILRKELFNYK